MNSIVKTQKLEVLPLNTPPSGAYSFKGGSQLIQIQIADSPQLLLPSTVRLNFKFRCNTPTSTFSNPVLPGQSNSTRAAYDFHLNDRIGVASVIDTITLSSLTGQTLESIKSYNRFMSAVMPVVHSRGDYNAQLSLTDPFLSSQQSIGDNATSIETEVSLPLMTGLLNSNDVISLGSNGLRGLQILINLAPDNQVIKSSAADGAQAFYELIDVSLTADTLIPDEKGVAELNQAKSGVFEYNSVSHLYNVINSSDSTTSLSIGLDKVKSITHVFSPTTHNNNVTVDSFETGQIKNAAAGVYNQNVVLDRVMYSRGGVKFPIDYEIDVSKQTNVPKVDLIRNFTDSIKPNQFKGHSLVSVNTELGLKTLTDEVDDEPLQLETVDESYIDSDAKPVFGLGVRFDKITDSGVSFKGQDYAIRIQSNLNGSSPNSIHSFVMAKNKLMYSPQGFGVSS